MIRIVLVVLCLLTIWSILIEPRWLAHRVQDISFPDGQKQGLKVIHTADWHFTKRPLWRVMTHERAEQIIKEINQTNPDIVLITGDLIAEPRQKPSVANTVEDEIAITLSKIQASKGVYAVLGNHDNWYSHHLMKKALRKRGIHVLENEAVYLTQAKLWIAGIGDESTGHANVAQALKPIPKKAKALVMMHDPASLVGVPKQHNSLSFAGHTHGGQISIPFYGALIIPSKAPASWAYGWVKHQQNYMYVTSGLGVSLLPIRFNMRPEWVEFTI